MDRYDRNGIISKEEQRLLKTKRVCIIGCGGLGGYSIEMLARIGVGSLTVVDGDVFNKSNLNRQLLCLTDTNGKSKAFTAFERIQKIDEELHVNAVATYIDDENVMDILQDHDLVVDALDSNVTRKLVLNACETLKIPCIYGAIAGWYGQVSTVFPEDQFLKAYLKHARSRGVETDIGNPSFTPALVASYQVAEALKVLLSRGGLLREKILYVDLLNNEVEFLERSYEETM